MPSGNSQSLLTWHSPARLAGSSVIGQVRDETAAVPCLGSPVHLSRRPPLPNVAYPLQYKGKEDDMGLLTRSQAGIERPGWNSIVELLDTIQSLGKNAGQHDDSRSCYVIAARRRRHA